MSVARYNSLMLRVTEMSFAIGLQILNDAMGCHG
jgi:hypothetical protein